MKQGPLNKTRLLLYQNIRAIYFLKNYRQYFLLKDWLVLVFTLTVATASPQTRVIPGKNARATSINSHFQTVLRVQTGFTLVFVMRQARQALLSLATYFELFNWRYLCRQERQQYLWR